VGIDHAGIFRASGFRPVMIAADVEWQWIEGT
jgi:hypothetical protein